ncbi:hypothetical protein [Methylopila sp. 73B]|uniref:hypothetical protein n=1 Tax=Methylopila sp. 73B TaxID=1120792 RepID=UPI0012DE3449|nr:hypothetical protein [Methylopila sp. 73B]
MSFRASQVKLADLQSRIGKLERRIREFAHSNTSPFRLNCEYNDYYDIEIKFDQIPDDIFIEVEIVLNQLKSTLDAAVFSASKTHPDFVKKDPAFPFARSHKDWSSQSKDLRYVSQDVKTYIQTLKPYGDGDTLLFAISDLSKSGRHWALAPLSRQNALPNGIGGNPYGDLNEQINLGELTGLMMIRAIETDSYYDDGFIFSVPKSKFPSAEHIIKILNSGVILFPTIYFEQEFLKRDEVERKMNVILSTPVLELLIDMYKCVSDIVIEFNRLVDCS